MLLVTIVYYKGDLFEANLKLPLIEMVSVAFEFVWM